MTWALISSQTSQRELGSVASTLLTYLESALFPPLQGADHASLLSDTTGGLPARSLCISLGLYPSLLRSANRVVLLRANLIVPLPFGFSLLLG